MPRAKRPPDPLRVSSSCAIDGELAARLESVRRDLVADQAAFDTAFGEPECLLADYASRRKRSQLDRILTLAPRVAAEVDRLVVLGPSGYLSAVRAVLAAGCHPRHNDLDRAARSGQPRVTLVDCQSDNDALAGALDLVAPGRPSHDLTDRWALAIHEATLATAEGRLAAKLFVDALSAATGRAAAADRAPRLLFFAAEGSELGEIAAGAERFSVPPSSRPAQAPLSAACLAPVAIAGVDVVRLLAGAAATVADFRQGSLSEGAFQLAALGHSAAEGTPVASGGASAALWLIAAWAEGLVATGRWLERVLEASEWPTSAARPFAKTLGPATARSAARLIAGPHALVIHFAVDEVRRDRLSAGEPAHVAAAPQMTLAAWDHAAWSEATQSLSAAGVSQATIHLPCLDEASLGRLFATCLLAAELIRRLAAGV